LIADEPTTALDVTIQAQILELLVRLRDELAMSILLITHDLGVVAEYADEVIVMYAGKLVEWAPVGPLFRHPRHPYTEGLLRSIPTLEGEMGPLPTIPGTVPGTHERKPGCPFVSRCTRALAACEAQFPEVSRDGEHGFACWNPLP
jgi:oligopeptide/dipeptide ABC transporter ATP-binding protein